jgi:hypothetical protein
LLLSFISKQLVFEAVIFTRESLETKADESKILDYINKMTNTSIDLLCDDDNFDDSSEISFLSTLLY